MFSHPNIRKLRKTHHDWLLDHMRTAYHLEHVRQSGVCFGVSLLGIHAALSGRAHLAAFDQRLKELYEAEKKKETYPDSKNFYSKANSTFFTNRAFLERVAIYSLPNQFATLLNVAFQPNQISGLPYTQSLLLSDHLTSSALDERIAQPFAFTGVYSNQDLLYYICSLREAAMGSPTDKHPVCLLLSLGKHTVGLIYDISKNTWGVIDSSSVGIDDNNHEIRGTLYFNSARAVTNCLWSILRIYGNKEEHAVFHTRCFAKQSALSDMQPIFNAWQQDQRFTLMRTISAEKACYQNDNHDTWLSIAALEGDEADIDALIAHGADPNVVNSRGDTPLLLAAMGGYTKVAHALCAANQIDCSYRHPQQGYTALSKAAMSGYVDMAAMLVDRVDVNAITECGNTALAVAADFNQEEMIRFLRAKGGSIVPTPGVSPQVM